MKSDVLIGLEVHCELATNTKLFCGCARIGNDEPNSRTCEVCLGFPGAKPVINKKVVEFALRLCLALKSKISSQIIFSRKSYFYPDLAKGYQITQYELPLGTGGEVKLANGKKIKLERVHIEEDPASLIHPSGVGKSEYVLVDYNRSGNPLIELVTRPEIYSAEDARDFMKQLIIILRYLNIFEVKTCIIKADVNVSVKESGYIRVEVKNVTGFKDIERVVEHEIVRQNKNSKNLVQETRGWDSEKGVSFPLRTKETEEDYGYIIDSNLVPINITKKMVDKVKVGMPELAYDRVTRFVKDYKIDKTTASVICNEIALAELFEKVVKEVDALVAAKWFRKELLRVVNYNKLDIDHLTIDETHIIDLLSLLVKRTISDAVGRQVLEELVVLKSPKLPSEIVMSRGLGASDDMEMEAMCKKALKNNPKVVAEYKNGKIEALNFLVGNVMRQSKGKADAIKVKKLLREITGIFS